MTPTSFIASDTQRGAIERAVENASAGFRTTIYMQHDGREIQIRFTDVTKMVDENNTEAYSRLCAAMERDGTRRTDSMIPTLTHERT